MRPPDSNTRTLLLRWHEGDRDALESLLAQHLAWLRDYVHSRLGARLREKEETGDLVQEAALEVLQYIPRFVLSDSDQFRALLARLVENVLRDRVRWYRAHRRDVNREQSVDADAVLDLDTPFCSKTTPSGTAARRERDQLMRLCLELLDPIDREVIYLRDWKGMSFAEVARATSVKEDTARMRYRRALPRLAHAVQIIGDGALSRWLEPES